MHNALNRTSSVSGLESLESRRLLSASIENGVLMVDGTNHSDEITLRLNHDDSGKLDVSINGEVTQFTVSDITGGVKIEGHNGKDHLMVSDTEGDITLNVTMMGGSGRDVLRGGAETDELFGGNGKDLIYAGGGDDWCVGGRGNDEMHGEAGDDVLHGGRGKDELNGDEGDDDLDGGKGKDAVFGDDGNDDFSSHDRKNEETDKSGDDDGDNATESDHVAD
jgi:Ca2+-binding RTX toxin-like protein